MASLPNIPSRPVSSSLQPSRQHGRASQHVRSVFAAHKYLSRSFVSVASLTNRRHKVCRSKTLEYLVSRNSVHLHRNPFTLRPKGVDGERPHHHYLQSLLVNCRTDGFPSAIHFSPWSSCVSFWPENSCTITFSLGSLSVVTYTLWVLNVALLVHLLSVLQTIHSAEVYFFFIG